MPNSCQNPHSPGAPGFQLVRRTNESHIPITGLIIPNLPALIVRRRIWGLIQEVELRGGTQPLRYTDFASDDLLGGSTGGWPRRAVKASLIRLEDCMSILSYQFQPCQESHLGKVDSAKTQTSEKEVYPITHMLVLERIDTFSDGFWAVRISPTGFHLCMSLFQSSS